MAIGSKTRSWLKVLVIIPLIAAFSFTSLAFAQEGQGTQQQPVSDADEWAARRFATVEQRQLARQERSGASFDNQNVRNRWCNADDWIILGGESLSDIVLNCNIAMANILAVNPQISNPDLVFSGEFVRLPNQQQRQVTPGTAGTSLTLTAAQQEYMGRFTTQAQGQGIPVTGEGAQDISGRNYASGREAQQARQRDLTRFDDPSYRAQWCNNDYWVVAPGDTLGQITIRCGIPIDILLAHNPQINNGDIIIVGEMIRLPDDRSADNQPGLTEAQQNYLGSNFDTSPGQ